MCLENLQISMNSFLRVNKIINHNSATYLYIGSHWSLYIGLVISSSCLILPLKGQQMEAGWVEKEDQTYLSLHWGQAKVLLTPQTLNAFFFQKYDWW